MFIIPNFCNPVCCFALNTVWFLVGSCSRLDSVVRNLWCRTWWHFLRILGFFEKITRGLIYHQPFLSLLSSECVLFLMSAFKTLFLFFYFFHRNMQGECTKSCVWEQRTWVMKTKQESTVWRWRGDYLDHTGWGFKHLNSVVVRRRSCRHFE